MYFPYLRGKQFELLALRELANEIKGDFKFTPIIEPVKITLTGLTTAINSMLENHLKFALVLNPYEGDFKYKSLSLLDEISYLRDRMNDWIPAFVYNSHSLESIKEMILHEDLDHIMILCQQTIDINDIDLMEVLNNPKVEYLVVCNGDSRTTMRNLFRIFPLKKFIRLDDNFNEATRNADYILQEDESFTEQHLFYRTDRFYGFGDYTALTKNFIEGGMLPFAVAIHLTYQREDEVVYIHHFVSDTNDDRSNIQGKFFEAAQKVEDFYAKGIEKTQAVIELINLISEERYPGLGFLKKLSIKNSIQLMNHILSSENESMR